MATPEEYGKKGTPLQHTRQSMILERLNNGMDLSITELAREFDVSTKTLQRDFDKLNTILPGQIERADDGRRYRKSKRHRANNDGEIIIEMIDSLVRGIGGNIYTKAHRLLTELRTHIDRPFYTRIDVEDISDKLELVALLEKAMAEQRAVTLTYHRWYDGEADKTYADVYPLKIVVYNGFWYLLAEHEGYSKKFYLKEIHTCEIQDDTFIPNKDILERMEDSINVWFEPKNEPFEVILWLDKDAVFYFERKPIAKSQKLYKKPDGTAELVVKITSEEEIFPVVKFWLPTVRILEPETLQEKFETMLKRYLQGGA